MKSMKVIRDQSGFTLMEMLISAAVFAIVLTAVYLMLITNQVTYARGENKVEIQQNGRVAMRRIAREIRMAGYDPASAIPAQASQTAVQVANANTITFIVDLDGDDVSDQITYRLQGNQIIRESSSWVGGAWTPNPPVSSELADSVSALSFTYFDNTDTVTATLADIRRITLGITVQDTSAGFQDTFPLTVDVRLRNP
jgi:prepilin-type N-terminal cleavage/methylation domain-containing protein